MNEYEKHKRMMERVEDAAWMYKRLQAQQLRKEKPHNEDSSDGWIIFFALISIAFILLLIVSVIKF